MSTAPIRSEGQTRSTRSTILIIVAVGGIVLFFGFFIVIGFGVVVGDEFEPYSAQHRSFTYYEIPFIHVPISPVVQSVSRPPLEQHLVRKGYWPIRKGKRWDLAAVARGGLQEEADVQVLMEYLTAGEMTGDQYWLDWTKRHKATAKELWPEVALLGRLDLYPYVAVLFEAADKHPDPKDYIKVRRNSLIPLLTLGIQAATEEEDWSKVVRLATAGMEFDADPQSWRAARADAFEKLGLNDKAARDRRGSAKGASSKS